MSVFPAKATRISKPRCAGARRRLCAGFLLQIQPASRHAGRRAAKAGAERREDSAAGRRCRSCCWRSRTRPINAVHRPAPCRCCSKSRAAMPARSWAARPICSRCMSKAPARLIGQIRDVHIEALTANSLQGAARFERAAPNHRRTSAASSYAGIPRQQAAGRAERARIRSISPGSSRSLGIRITQRGNLIALSGASERARGRRRSCARFMRGWKQAKASPWPKWMPKSASPIPAATRPWRE